MFIKHAIFENTMLRKSVHELAPGQIEIIFILQKSRLLHGSFTFMPNNLPVSTSFIFEIGRTSGKTRGNRRLRPYEPNDPLDHPLPSPSWFRPHPSTDLRHLATRSPLSCLHFEHTAQRTGCHHWKHSHFYPSGLVSHSLVISL